MDIQIFFLPLYFGIIFAGLIEFSNDALSDDEDEKVDYNEIQICIDNVPDEFGIYPFQRNMKTSVDPCTDFYEYGCGNWQKNNPMPEDLAINIWSTLHQMQMETYRRIHELLMKEDKDDELPFIKIAKQCHRSCMNEAIEDEGLKPMKLIWKATGEWLILMSNEQWYKKNYTWQNTYKTYNELYGFSNIFSLVYKQDERDKTRNIFQIYHSLDNKKYFIKDTCPHVNVDTITKVVQAFAADEGINIPIKKLRADVNEIIIFERNLRKLIRKEEKTKVTRMQIAELQEFYDSLTKALKPSAKINWLDMIQSSFKDINIIINASETVLVNKKFLSEMAVLLDATPPRIIVNYVQWNMVCRLMKYLNKQMRNIESDFHLTSNMTQQNLRWVTCVQDEWMQDIKSYLYVKTYISADVLKAISEMVNDIIAEIKERITHTAVIHDNLMKQHLMYILNKLLTYIGYPKWYNNQTTLIELYKGLELGENYLHNKLVIAKHEKQNYARFINKNIDIWPIYPIQVTALHARDEDKWSNGVIVIPAAIIQDPFFKTNRPSAFNYGAIGFTIGHELAHSLDNMENTRSRNCLIEYYNNITLGVTNNNETPISYGDMALKENIADIIGIQAAFAAFRKNKTKMERQSKLWVLENVTHEQLFFLSFANIMCAADVSNFDVIPKISEHSPKNFRVIGSVSNTKFFSEVFKCPLGSPMNPKSKCKIWE